MLKLVIVSKVFRNEIKLSKGFLEVLVLDLLSMRDTI